MDSLIKLLQQRFNPVAQQMPKVSVQVPNVPQMAKQAVSGFQQSPLGALAQGKPQQFMPALKQRVDYFAQHPQNISFGGEMQAVNPGGFAGALPLNTRVDQMTSQPMGGPSLARPGFDKIKPIDFNRTNPAKFTEANAGWQPGMKEKFDLAMLTNDAKQVKAMLPFVPPAYQQSFAQKIGAVLGSVPKMVLPARNGIPL